MGADVMCSPPRCAHACEVRKDVVLAWVGAVCFGRLHCTLGVGVHVRSLALVMRSRVAGFLVSSMPLVSLID